ncbi:MAG TPA: hypothetical protein DF383_10555 [Deltaproteobacteria bacterium]|nr:hypothetical protein [Deltaproteobacteria bacterium]
MSQTAYPLTQPIGVNGQLADTGFHDVLTYNNPSVVIPFGRLLEKISGDANGVQLPDDGSANIVGVSLRDISREGTNYPLQSPVAVLRKGRMLVEVEEAVTPDSVPHYRFDGKKQQILIDFSGDFVASNTINLNVNGSPISQVTFSADQATTAGLLKAAIEAMPGVDVVNVSGNDFTVVSEMDAALEITGVVVTGGASQATATVTQTVAGVPTSDRGKLRASTDSGTAAPASGMKFLTEASAGELAVLDVNIP